jgi:dolichol-phosphate mannosyltransferase
VKSLVCVPTYNEAENIPHLIEQVLQHNPNVDILVIDDSSPDGTAQIVEKIAASEARVKLLLRAKKEGLGRAYLAGFAWAVENNYELVVEMDADFSHRPVDLKLILQSFTKDIDFIVGSRYVEGGSTLNWSFLRRLISRGGSFYARNILGYPLKDWTGGFNAWRASCLQKIILSSVTSNGYSFQIELKFKALSRGCRGLEIPILFEDRRVGQSKMSVKIVLEAFYRVWQIRFS